MKTTYVPNPNAADGQIGTGSNEMTIPESNTKITYVPNPNAADGTDGTPGGGGSTTSFINYAGPPLVNPPALANIVVDVNGQQWQYFQGAWH